MNKKKVIIISSSIFILLIITISIFIMFHNKKIIEQHYKDTFKNFEEAIIYLKGSNIQDEGEILVSAKYKGAHGEHYPRESTYLFTREFNNDEYIVSLGNEEGYVKKKYNNDLLKIYRRIKTSTINIKDDYEENIKDFMNDILNEDFKSCELKVKTSGLIKKVDSTDIICDNLKLILKDKKAIIEYDKNIINIEFRNKGYTLNINDELRLNAFLEDNVNKYSFVIGEDVFYAEIDQTGLKLNAASPKAIYNALDLEVRYKDIELKEEKEISEIEIPIFRYFNEYNFTYWRDYNE